MSCVVDVIRFQRPQRSDQSLFVSNLPSEVSSDELWASLHSAFSQFGLVHKITIPDKGDHKYGFVSFYSSYSCSSAQRCLDKQLILAGHTLRVVCCRERAVGPISPLHISDCVALANHYLGFNGWSSSITSLTSSDEEWMCQASVRVRTWDVESRGTGTISRENKDGTGTGRVLEGGAQKVSVNRACADAFSRLVLCVVQPGEKMAAVKTLQHEHLPPNHEQPQSCS
ncbi:RAD52 motif-containing protein 1-like [Halichondria panicea]|uniref:RAD52 motif-containing protein 1-like n=1 Tax=Halichondria panicea TaxID=6063 RepID=UPI00312B5C47